MYTNSLKKPALTFRASLVIVLTLSTVLLLFAIPLMDRFFWLLFIDLLLPVIVSFYILLFVFPIEIYSDWQIEKAMKKIRLHQKVLVIAVTGSYGKSLTKGYLAAILGKKFKVIKTDGKNNTAIGVARTILKKMDDTTEIFVAEISAYQRGEIRFLSKLIRPKIGVLTGIDSHYLSLFKTLDNIKKTNYELVESLPKNGICLFDGNNKNTFELYKKSSKQKVFYKSYKASLGEEVKENEIAAFNIIQKHKKITFEIGLTERKLSFVCSSHHHIQQLLPAIFIALHLGMTEQEIRRAIAALK